MQKRNPETVFAPLAAYSHQIEVTSPMRLLFMSGQVGQRPDGSIPADPVEQFEATLDNLRLNLEAAGMGVSNLVKMTMYLVGDIDTARRRAALLAWLGTHEPCMTLLYVSALATPEYRVEIDAWACEDGVAG